MDFGFDGGAHSLRRTWGAAMGMLARRRKRRTRRRRRPPTAVLLLSNLVYITITGVDNIHMYIYIYDF